MNYDNPPAFPIPEVRTEDGIGISEGAPGMTLRDWYAGQALGGTIAAFAEAGDVDMSPAYPRIAQIAYGIADAMLSARKDA